MEGKIPSLDEDTGKSRAVDNDSGGDDNNNNDDMMMEEEVKEDIRMYFHN